MAEWSNYLSSKVGYKERTNSISSRRCSLGNFIKSCLLDSASPECQRMASSIFRARPSWSSRRVPVHSGEKTDPPQGWRSPFRSRSLIIRSMVSQLLSHVMQEEIRIRIDRLSSQGLDGIITSSLELGRVAASAFGSFK